jgi:hypothetical protein
MGNRTGVRFQERRQRVELGFEHDGWLPGLNVAGRVEQFIREDDTRPFRPVDDRDHTFVEVGGAARTRVFGRRFSPEVGYARGSPGNLDPERTYE